MIVALSWNERDKSVNWQNRSSGRNRTQDLYVTLDTSQHLSVRICLNQLQGFIILYDIITYLLTAIRFPPGGSGLEGS